MHAKGASPARSTPCLASNLATPTPEPHTLGTDELVRAPLPGLTALALYSPRIPNDCWPRLLAAPWASRLSRLSLDEEPLGTCGGASGAGLHALARAPLPALVDLAMGNSDLAPADLSETLAAAPWLGQLTRLHLSFNMLGPAGLAAVASLRLPRLRCLCLIHVCTTEAGLVALGAAPWLPGLTRLELEEEPDEEEVYEEFGEVVSADVCNYILEGRGFSAGNPFAPLAREGVIVKHFA
jgi:hypothetical protein